MTTTTPDPASRSDADLPVSCPEPVQWSSMLVTFLILLVFSWLGITLSHQSGGVATIWFTNGLLFALVIRKPRSVWIPYFAIGLTADILSDVFTGDPVGLALGVSLANSIEVITSCLLVTRWFGSPLNLSRRRPLLGFLGIAVIGGPAVSGLLGPAWMMFYGTSNHWLEAVRIWYLGDMLGMAIIAPLVYILQRPGFFTVLQRRELPKTLAVLAIPLLVTVVIFSQNDYPLTFMIFPALLFVVFQRGFPGAVLAIFIVTCAAMAFTVTGHGPLMLIVSATLLGKIVVLQLFLATALFTAFLVAALLEERQSLQSSLQEGEARYRALANTDALTGTRNRRAFERELSLEWEHALAEQTPLSLLSIDVDHFKAFNDIYGHIAGDGCLRLLAQIMTEALRNRPEAAIYRMGGEEFAVLLPKTAREAALVAAETLRQSIADRRLEHSGSPIGHETISVGVATETPSRETVALSLLTLSDRALYLAKGLGRNRIEALDGAESVSSHGR